MKTLIQMSRDIYPHDRIPDRFYAIAAKPFDEKLPQTRPRRICLKRASRT